ncbi:MAG TPA: hypothetical protein ENF47_06195 [Thermoprotei archaeon]|nr:hypothetical protein [Thermoprotei archaeon]
MRCRRLIIFLLLLVTASTVYSSSRVSGYTILTLRVVDMSDNPLKNAYVTIVSPPPGSIVLADGYTDSNGVIGFELESPPEELYVFVSWKKVIVYQSRISSYIGSETIKCKVGDIRIKVITESLQPINGAEATLTWNTTIGPQYVSNTTDKDGIMIFDRMPLIKYKIDIKLKGRLVYSNLLKAVYNQLYTILLKLYNLKIMVLDADDRSVPNTRVIIEGNAFRITKWTDENGVIELNYMPPGNYRIHASFDKYMKKLNVTLDRDETIKIRFDDLRSYKLDIYVYDSLNNPISYAKIGMYNPASNVRELKYTDKNGVARFKLYPGKYFVRVEYGNIIKQSEINVNSDTKIEIRMNLQGRPPEQVGGEGEFSIPFHLLLPIVIVAILTAIVILAFHYIIVRSRR